MQWYYCCWTCFQWRFISEWWCQTVQHNAYSFCDAKKNAYSLCQPWSDIRNNQHLHTKTWHTHNFNWLQHQRRLEVTDNRITTFVLQWMWNTFLFLPSIWIADSHTQILALFAWVILADFGWFNSILWEGISWNKPKQAKIRQANMNLVHDACKYRNDTALFFSVQS